MTLSTIPIVKTATVPLGADEVQKYRSMVKSAVVLMLLWRLGRASGSSELAEILGVQRETVAGYLKSLALVGLVTRTGVRDSYCLTEGSQQLLLQSGAGYVLDETHILAFGNQPHALTLHSSQSAPATTVLDAKTVVEDMSVFPTFGVHPDDLEAAMSEIPTLNVGKTDIEPLKTLKKEEDINSFKENTSSFLESANVGNSDISEFANINHYLESADLLFGETVISKGIDLGKLTSKIVLGWLAQAYTQKTKIRNPARLVYCRLRDGELPQKKYLKDPLPFLRTDFLVEAGLLEKPAATDEEDADELLGESRRTLLELPDRRGRGQS